MKTDIFKLTPEQQRAFNRLKKAYADCLKAGVFFYNTYGSLRAVDRSLINGYSDNTAAEGHVSDHVLTDAACHLNIANEWSDDEHAFHLTPKGWKLFNEDSDK
jgi:hypothetical protein